MVIERGIEQTVRDARRTRLFRDAHQPTTRPTRNLPKEGKGWVSIAVVSYRGGDGREDAGGTDHGREKREGGAVC